MSYESVDKLQKLLADEVFSYTNDKKKAAGRALGTFLEIITYYLIKTWHLEHFAAIEKALPEFANAEITHNVEFTLHGSRKLAEKAYCDDDLPISGTSILRTLGLTTEAQGLKSVMLIDKNNILRNACTLRSDATEFVNAYVDSLKGRYSVCRLIARPFSA